MPMETRHKDGVTIVDLSGRLDSAVSNDVTEQLTALVDSGHSKLIMNMKELAYLSSAGLRSLLVAAKLAKSANGEMRLCEPNGRVAKVLNEAGFDFLIKIDSDEAQSIAALRG